MSPRAHMPRTRRSRQVFALSGISRIAVWVQVEVPDIQAELELCVIAARARLLAEAVARLRPTRARDAAAPSGDDIVYDAPAEKTRGPERRPGTSGLRGFDDADYARAALSAGPSSSS